LKRAIQRNVQDKLAEAILAGEIADGETVRIGVNDGGLSIDAQMPAKKAAE
jgi:ATP-dependent Clp protease ATP-binding subunit ClpB